MQELALRPARVSQIDLATLWCELTAGQLVVSHAYCDRGRSFARVDERKRQPGFPLPTVKVLERAFLGESQKLLALNAEVSNATIASQCAHALCAMAPAQIVSRAPILLVMAAHAAHGLVLESARIDESSDGTSRVISCEIPGTGFDERLSPGEHEVALLLIAGKKHVEIAEQRHTSVRTTANQLASIFSKLAISGRAELRSKAIIEASKAFSLRKAVAHMPSPSGDRRPLTLAQSPVSASTTV